MIESVDGAGRSACPIATTLDLIGDKWSMIIVRDMINGKCRFNDFLESPEAITASILTARLRQLEDAGLISREPYQRRPVRFEYKLTQKGADLLPVLQAICRWANAHYPQTWKAPASFMARRRPGPGKSSGPVRSDRL